MATIAWAAIAILILLLPGFFSLKGLTRAERFSRDTTPRTAVGQLAFIVSVSVFIHVVLIWTVRLLAHYLTYVPHVDLRLVLSALQAGTVGAATVTELAESISSHLVAIPIYLASASIGGFGLGCIVSKHALRGPLNFLLEHAWVYGLAAPEKGQFAPTYAYILSKVSEGNRWLLYKGPLHSWGLDKDGRFSYVVVRSGERSYLKFEDLAPTTTAGRVIGASRFGDAAAQALAAREIDFLYIDGSEISNIIFERYPVLDPEAAVRKRLDELAAGRVVEAQATVAGIASNRQ